MRWKPRLLDEVGRSHLSNAVSAWSRSLVGEAAETREADKRRDEVLLIQTRFDHGRDLGFFGCASRIMPGSILLS